MKKLILLASLLAPIAAQAEPLPGASSNVTIKLVSHDYTFVSESSSGFSSKLVKYSYGNRQLLSDLLAEGLLGEGEKLEGWKLVVVDRTPLAESEDSTLVFYAVKSGKTPVQIPSSRLGLNVNLPASVDAEVVKFKDDQVSSRKTSFKALVNLSGSASLEAGEDSYSDSFDLNALASGSDATVTRKLKEDSVWYTFDYILLNAVTLSPVLGTSTDHLDGDTQTPVEGSITFSAFSAIDIQNYPFADSSIR